jgi:dolichyl-phosphate-mannose--protein O-mannosyl transferase
MTEQNFANHTKFVPLFHVVVLGVLALNFLWSIYRWKLAEFSLDGLVSVLLAAILILLAFFARIFALTVQDRVIRLEERLRYERLLPADLRPRIGEFTLGQLVSLRFASDAELPLLARKVLDEKLTDRKAIKQLIKNWKPDYLRA